MLRYDFVCCLATRVVYFIYISYTKKKKRCQKQPKKCLFIHFLFIFFFFNIFLNCINQIETYVPSPGIELLTNEVCCYNL